MKLSITSRKIIFRTVIAALVLVAIALALSILVQSITIVAASLFSAGVILMSAMNCFKVYLLERTVNKVSYMDNATIGKAYAMGQYFLRYFLTFFVAAAAILTAYLITGVSPFLSFSNQEPSSTEIYSPITLGLVVGLFTMHIGLIGSRHTKPEEPPAEEENEKEE